MTDKMFHGGHIEHYGQNTGTGNVLQREMSVCELSAGPTAAVQMS